MRETFTSNNISLLINILVLKRKEKVRDRGPVFITLLAGNLNNMKNLATEI
jgi:hypothetical protein